MPNTADKMASDTVMAGWVSAGVLNTRVSQATTNTTYLMSLEFIFPGILGESGGDVYFLLNSKQSTRGLQGMQ